jgi:putative transcriptional regulator
MVGSEVQRIRGALGLNQVQCAQLLGVHPLTISKWERGVNPVPPHYQALLESFKKARAAKESVGEDVAKLLVTAGAVMAILVLLETAFRSKK